MASLEVSAVRPTEAHSTPWMRDGARASYGLATLVYLVATTLTRPVFISDTMHYLGTANPGSAEFWDFGHLVWRPMLSVLLEHLNAPEPAARFLQAFDILDVLSTIAGLAAVWLAIATLRQFTRTIAPAAVSAILLSFSQVVLTHSKGGCAYIFGFLALSAGFYTVLAASNGEKWTWMKAVISGALLALAVCLWFPYVLAVPGALLAPVLLSKQPKRKWRLPCASAMMCAVIGAGAYSAVAIHIGIRSFRGFVGWVQASSHGVRTSGAKRVVFGFARSFVSLGENGAHGVVFKRFLLLDPYNPVHFWQILGATLSKLALFYVFLAFVLVAVASTPRGRRAGIELLATVMPVLGFAVMWAGTDLERYLPLFPAWMLAIGLGLSNVRLRSATAAVTGVFALTLVIANLTSFWASGRERELRELTGTVRSLNELLPPESLVLLPPMHPLERIYWDFPEALPLAEHGLKLERIVDLGTDDTPQWRARICAQMSQRWAKQIPVVIESSLLESMPRRDSSWVEGDDPRVRWRDINDFVGKLEIGDRVGDTDFFQMPATTRNIEAMNRCR